MRQATIRISRNKNRKVKLTVRKVNGKIWIMRVVATDTTITDDVPLVLTPSQAVHLGVSLVQMGDELEVGK